MYHTPVLAETAVRLLITNPDGVYVDGTLGGGGHSRLILERLGSSGRVVGLDQDRDAIEFCQQSFRDDHRLLPVESNFSNVSAVLDQLGIAMMDGILLDLGISSHQVDTPQRGFSFKYDGPLDMRMNTAGGLSAAEIVNTADERTLSLLIRDFGEERNHKRIARAIVASREHSRVETTSELRRIIEHASSPVHADKTCARVFQALRIYVNGELDALGAALDGAYSRLRNGGRMVVISYHSLEDRIVKHFFRDIVTSDPANPYSATSIEQRFTILTKKPIIPDDHEILGNPRARSARLRAAEKN